MRLFKLLVTLIILCIIGLFIYQNMPTWRQLISFKLDLKLFATNPAQPPSLELYGIILLSALGGFIVGLGLLLKPYFRTRRMLKRERQERKQAQEDSALRQTASESHEEAPAPSAHTNQESGSEKGE
jgi:uncharacterized integral membrane protein